MHFLQGFIFMSCLMVFILLKLQALKQVEAEFEEKHYNQLPNLQCCLQTFLNYILQSHFLK